MTAGRLREFKSTDPFKPFTIHMNDGSKFEITDPENLVVHKDWTVDAIVLMPGGEFHFLYLKNLAHVSGRRAAQEAGR